MSERARLDDVIVWIDALAAPLPAEDIALTQTAGRVLAASVAGEQDLPPFDRAATDGFALRADETVGASAYNPLTFRVQPASAALAAGCTVEVQSGDPLPAGADAVVRADLVMSDMPGSVALIAPVPAGNEIEGAGSHAVRDATLGIAGRQLRPRDVGLLA